MGKDSMVKVVTEKDIAVLRGQSEEAALKHQSAHSAFISETVYAKLVNDMFTRLN
jgi:hypothetical protein